MPRSTFPCGHKGKGQYCHACKQASDQAAKARADKARLLDARRTDKAAWEATFTSDSIDLRPLQTRERVTKAREILKRLELGEVGQGGGGTYVALGGKRWESDRTIISVPIGWGYRLVLRDEGGELRPLQVMTHEAYNGLKPGAFREEVRRGR